MHSAYIQNVAAIIGVIVALVGFIALVYQLRQVERGLQSSARGSIYDMAARLKEVFLRHPELRPLFFNGEPVGPEDERYGLAIAVADYYALYLEQIITQGEALQPSIRQSWYDYTEGIYAKSPILRHYLSDKRSWYTEAFWETVENTDS